MKKLLLFFIVVFVFSGCSSPKQQADTTISDSISVNDSVPTVFIEQEKADTLKPSDMYSNALDLPEFQDCMDLGGALISDDYGVHVLQHNEKKITYLLFDELSARSENGLPLWKLLDTLQINGTELNIGWTGNVMLNGEIDNELIALLPDNVDWMDTEVFKNVKRVWRFDRQAQKIVEMPKQGITCKNDMYGID